MRIAFFITEQGEVYADIERTSVDREKFLWLSEQGVDLGRKESFSISRESPDFKSVTEAVTWLRSNLFREAEDCRARTKGVSDAQIPPTQDEYENCAILAKEITEIAAAGRLAELLPLENDHAFLCSVGNWYWSLGHGTLARMAFHRSIEIQPEAPTFLNLAVCCDDLGESEAAAGAMVEFYARVPCRDEKEQVEEMLRNDGKDHLIRPDS